MKVALIAVTLIVAAILAAYNFTTAFEIPQRLENCWTANTPCMRART